MIDSRDSKLLEDTKVLLSDIENKLNKYNKNNQQSLLDNDDQCKYIDINVVITHI